MFLGLDSSTQSLSALVIDPARGEIVREVSVNFGAALPAAPTGPDPYNRLAELEGRLATFKHVWDTRFMLSLELAGFCRERGACPP